MVMLTIGILLQKNLFLKNIKIPVKYLNDRSEENTMWSSTVGRSPRNGEVNLESVNQANSVSN